MKYWSEGLQAQPPTLISLIQGLLQKRPILNKATCVRKKTKIKTHPHVHPFFSLPNGSTGFENYSSDEPLCKMLSNAFDLHP